MKREDLIKLGVPEEALEKIMLMSGADIEREKAKAAAIQNERDAAVADRDSLKARLEEVQGKLKAFDGADLEQERAQRKQLEKDIEDAKKAHEAELAEFKKAQEMEVAQIKRETETREFLSAQKFINKETATHFEGALNSALVDKQNEGKNRKDLFDALILGEDGKPRTDIFVPPESPNKLILPPIGNGPAPKLSFEPPKII
jgi:ribosomal protein S6